MSEHVFYLDLVQFRALRARVIWYLRHHQRCRRRYRRGGLTISAALRLLLVSFRHNLTQRLLAVMFRVPQSTVCRALRWMRSILAEVLADEIAAAGDAGAALERILGQAGGRPVVVLLDGTLAPTADRFYDPRNYSGKHGRIGRNLQVVADVGGRLLCAGPPQAGRLHDRAALAESGLEPLLKSNPRLLVHADRGYRGTRFIVPAIRPRHGRLSPAQLVENREISAIRNAVERAIAHLKILAILRTGFRTRSPHREQVISETIAVAIGLVFLRQKAWTQA